MATKIPQNTAEFRLDELVSVAQGRLVSAAEVVEVRGIATDTREDLRGKAFVALVGETYDGHDYLDRAREAGAQVAIVNENSGVDAPPGLALIEVADTLIALGELAYHHRMRWDGKLVAVVGSAGKTTTRAVISALLEENFPGQVHSTVGNLNNRIGVPMVLLGLEGVHVYAAIELGTNCTGEIAMLGRMASPDVAVLTLIDLEHTLGLGDLDGVQREESAVFQHLRADGTAVGFGDDARVFESLSASGARVLSYGFEPERDLRIEERELVGDSLSRVTLRWRSGSTVSVITGLVGRPGALAVAAGVSAVEAVVGRPLDAASCERALVSAGQPGRTEVIVLEGARIVVDDSYNSNPASVKNSIATGNELCERSGGRLWLVLGEMLELGEHSKSAHEEMGRMAAQSGAAGAFFVQGDAFLSVATAQKLAHCQFFEDATEVAAALGPLFAERDVVVVKASRGVRAERVVQGLKAFYKPAPTASAWHTGEGSRFSP